MNLQLKFHRFCQRTCLSMLIAILSIPAAISHAQTFRTVANRDDPEKSTRTQLLEAAKLRKELELTLRTIDTDRSEKIAPAPDRDLSKSIEKSIREIKEQQILRKRRLDKLAEEVDDLLVEFQMLNRARPIGQPERRPENANPVQGERPAKSPPNSNVEKPMTAQNPPSPETVQTPGKTDDSVPSGENANSPTRNPTLERLTRSPSVDDLGLANNLYMAGHHRHAKRAYSKLTEKEHPPAIKSWIHFQLGNCYQRLGQFVEARRHYREAAESEVEDVSNQTAKWWLDQLDQRESILNRVEALNAKIKQLADIPLEEKNNE